MDNGDQHARKSLSGSILIHLWARTGSWAPGQRSGHESGHTSDGRCCPRSCLRRRDASSRGRAVLDCVALEGTVHFSTIYGLATAYRWRPLRYHFRGTHAHVYSDCGNGRLANRRRSSAGYRSSGPISSSDICAAAHVRQREGKVPVTTRKDRTITENKIAGCFIVGLQSCLGLARRFAPQ